MPNDEKDLLIYIYNRSKNSTNAVYVPYDNAAAISLKYKRILRRYDTPVVARPQSDPKKDCYLYGIRQLPIDFIEKGKLQYNNPPSEDWSAKLDIYQ